MLGRRLGGCGLGWYGGVQPAEGGKQSLGHGGGAANPVLGTRRGQRDARGWRLRFSSGGGASVAAGVFAGGGGSAQNAQPGTPGTLGGGGGGKAHTDSTGSGAGGQGCVVIEFNQELF